MMYISSWTFYNIGRDYLGSITHITTDDGTLVAEYSYDPWGRLRNPATLEIYQPGYEPDLLLGRGFTGHEHLPWFGLINMNARLYDPLLGRFLQPDPYVQDPDGTQNFNRYSYALNNPLRYTDESGEIIGTIITVAIQVSLVLYKGIIQPYFVGFDDPAKAGRMCGDAWRNCGNRIWNAVKIDYGLIVTDSHLSAKERVNEFKSRFTDEWKQTLVGYIASHYKNNTGDVKSVSYYGGATVLETYSDGWGAVTFGNYIMGQNGITADPTNYLFQHEYGHYLQSKEAGIAYYATYGIPSLLSNRERHDNHPVEQDANIRALCYFLQYESGFDKTDSEGNYDGSWNKRKNPIDGVMWNNLADPANRSVLESRLNPNEEDYKLARLPIMGDILAGVLNAIGYIGKY